MRYINEVKDEVGLTIRTNNGDRKLPAWWGGAPSGYQYTSEVKT